MLCLKAEALGSEKIYSASLGVVLPVNISLQKTMQKGSSPCSSSGGGSTTCASLDFRRCNGGKGMGDKNGKSCCCRFHLEQEVRILQKQLQEEIDLHLALASAIEHDHEPILSPTRIPEKAQDLLANITALEVTVAKLEKELAALHFRLGHERNERLLAETHLRNSPSLASDKPWEEHISSLRAAKSSSKSQLLQKCNILKKSGPGNISSEENEIVSKTLWQDPNKLSEEMVRCMMDIFICLSDSSSIKMSSSESLRSTLSPVGHLSRSSLTSFSDSSIVPELHYTSEELDLENLFEPYVLNGKVSWKNIGSYGLAAEVCWMSVGKEQLDYAAESLKKYRSLVEQLSHVNPAQMSSNEKLAFWINLYNALIMHAYLAYGIPASDIKLFSLMQKATYTVGSQSFNAADIEFVLLKMKPPTHRPQISLVLALHKFKISEEHTKYAIDSHEPLVVFVLSSGMYSSPAVRIFTPDNVQDELKKSMKDYIRASIGISNEGKLLIPKLLHSYAKSMVEDSLLVDWICRHLTPDQVTVVRDSTSQKKQRLLGVRSFSVVPFDSRFRYLFLPQNKNSCESC